MRIHRQPKTLITGVGAVDQLGIEAKKLNGSKVLVITDQGVSECGMCVDVERPLVEAGLEVDFYDKAVPEPPMSTIEEIVRIVEKGGYDLIVGFGGGSPIDVAKAAAVLPHTGDTVYDYVGIDQVKKKGLPIIAIPTTAGTGSECTAIAIFANEKLNVKQGLVSPFLMPNVALIDPALTLSCPPNVTAASGMDALIHNIEAYISVNATMHTDSLAYEGIKLISQSIRTAVYDGTNMWARDAMAMGSMMGGIAFGNAGVGAVHALSYPIGGMFHVPHGVANTMVLPWAMDFNKLACLRWFRQFGEAMGENMDRPLRPRGGRQDGRGAAPAGRRPGRAAVPQRRGHPRVGDPRPRGGRQDAGAPVEQQPAQVHARGHGAGLPQHGRAAGARSGKVAATV